MNQCGCQKFDWLWKRKIVRSDNGQGERVA